MIWLLLLVPVALLVAYFVFNDPRDHPICGCTRCHYLRRHRESR